MKLNYDDVLIEKWTSVLRTEHEQIAANAAQMNLFAEISYNTIIDEDFELAAKITDDPERTLKYGKEALRRMLGDYAQMNIIENVNLVITSYKQSNVTLTSLGTDHASKIVNFQAIVKKMNSVVPVAIEVLYECQRCGQLEQIIIEDDTKEYIPQPTRCTNPACGKGKWGEPTIVRMKDVQIVEIQEPPDQMREGMISPRSMKLYCEIPFLNKLKLGERIEVTGLFELIPQFKGKHQKRHFKSRIKVINIERNAKEESEILTVEEEEKIKKMAQDKGILTYLSSLIAPHIKGNEDIKMGILCQAIGGNDITKADGTKIRGTLNLLVVGDPGTGKSKIAKWIEHNIPHSMYVDAQRTTEVGLTMTMKRDEKTGEWTAAAGAAILAANGILAIDQVEKLSDANQNALRECMEHQEISNAKADISMTIPARTSFFLVCNPKDERFTGFKDVLDEIPVTRTVMSRCDLVFLRYDIIDKEKDTKLAKSIVKMRNVESEAKDENSSKFLRKYISYVKKIRVRFTEEIENRIAEFFASKRQESKRTKALTLRQIETVCRLCESISKLKLEETVTESTYDLAIKMFIDSYSEIAIDPETHKFDIDRIETLSHSKSEKDRVSILIEIIEELDKENNFEGAPEHKILEMAASMRIEEKWAKHRLAVMHHEGDLYMPPNSRGYKLTPRS